jgi:transcriptional regulator with XRE-family HTH domain
MSEFASRIRGCRKNVGLTQKETAEVLGLSERTWQDYERGVRTPTFDGFIKIANVFNVSLDYLAGFTDDPKRR